MRKFYLQFSFFVTLLCLATHANAQLSTIGKEFWVGFMENNRILPGAPDQAVIVISANEDATGAIEYLGRSIAFTISQGEQFTHIVPSTELDLLHRNSGSVENKGIYISSSGKVAVYAFNERFRSADGTVVLPIGALGKDYLITSHFEVLTANVGYNGNVDNESTLLVVATEDDTEIEITPSVSTISGNPADSPFILTLDRGQSYQLKARADLTGSRVRVIGDNADECKKIAVFGGNKWTSVGNCGAANDNLFQQAYPVNTWGTSFVHVALSGRTSGELVKVLASEDGTQVEVNGIGRGGIDAGEFLSLEFGINETAKITTSKPSSVTVFSKSQECNQQNAPNAQNGDPFMITYSPVEQLLKEIRFNAMNLPSIAAHYVNIVVKTGTENLTVLDGQNLGANFFPVPGDPTYSYARINISQGVHQLTNREGFTAYVYGFGFLESYGFAVGAALDNLNFTTEAEYDFEVEGENVACLDQEGAWTINSENPDFTYFVWDFGDGTDPVVGKDVVHTFTDPGKYEIKVVAALSPNSCDQQEEVLFEVEVFELNADIIGETSVCPDVEQMVYKLDQNENIDSIAFSVEGGIIIENYGDSILVNWGPANDLAKVIAVPYNKNGCLGEEIILEVVINQKIVASLPEGEQTICFDPSLTHFYTVPNTSSGRGYEWQISGGQIVSGQNEKAVEVSWDQPGVTGILSYRVFSLVDQLCAGESEDLMVKVGLQFEARVKDLFLVGCSGSNSGEIELEITGGTSPYVVTWSHDPVLKTNKATGLKAGTYSVSILDESGCEIKLENLEITEPKPMSLISINPKGTSCYGKPDGALSFEIEGGVPPYSFDFEGIKSFSDQLTLNNLAQGKYEWVVNDSNGCSIPVAFEIVSPVAVKVEVRMEKPACPGGSNGELFAFPVGGIAPYVYTWDNHPTLGSQLLGVPKGNYNVSVTDRTGCISLGTGEVRESSPLVRMPSGFNPREETLFQGVSNCEIDFELWIYNRWGQLIYSGISGWDGLVEGEEVPTGSYSYLMRYTFPLEGKIEVVDKRGTFALIR
ncbi:MAG: PKD domain-containing protein [Algoriphagus sp.]|nr:PKD domain-containing protein [Algoriphagus sp.]